jgi:hypothetical protein
MLDHGWLRAHLQGDALHRPNVFTATARGVERLSEELDPVAPLCAGRLPRRSKLAHGLAIRDVFVSFLRADHANALELLNFHFEHDLAHHDVFRAARLLPDGLIQVQYRAGVRATALEVDLGTEAGAEVRAKLAKWAAFLGSAASRAVFPAENEGHMLFVTRGARRSASIGRLIADAGLVRLADVVTFAELDALLPHLYSRGPFAPPVRTARIPPCRQAPVATPFFGGAQRAFRTLRRFRPVPEGEP